jgi:hypothetical protein
MRCVTVQDFFAVVLIQCFLSMFLCIFESLHMLCIELPGVFAQRGCLARLESPRIRGRSFVANQVVSVVRTVDPIALYIPSSKLAAIDTILTQKVGALRNRRLGVCHSVSSVVMNFCLGFGADSYTWDRLCGNIDCAVAVVCSLFSACLCSRCCCSV